MTIKSTGEDSLFVLSRTNGKYYDAIHIGNSYYKHELKCQDLKM